MIIVQYVSTSHACKYSITGDIVMVRMLMQMEIISDRKKMEDIMILISQTLYVTTILRIVLGHRTKGRL